MIPCAANGICSVASIHSVDETVARFHALLTAREITLFALIDHSGEAQKVGMAMAPTKVLIFGKPLGGTPLMLASPTTAIDLPLKVLIAEDPEGRVTISWNDPWFLQQRHGFPPELVKNINVVEMLAGAAAS